MHRPKYKKRAQHNGRNLPVGRIAVNVSPRQFAQVNLAKRFAAIVGAARMVLTGYADPQSIADAVHRGAICKYLAKPWNSEK